MMAKLNLNLLGKIHRKINQKPTHERWFLCKFVLSELTYTANTKVSLKVRRLTSDDLDLRKLVNVDFWERPKDVLRNFLSHGQICHVAEIDERIIAYVWWEQNTFGLPKLGRDFKLTPAEIYTHSWFTLPSFRGKGVFQTLFFQAAKDMGQTSDITNIVVLINQTNIASQKTANNMGARRIANVGFVSFAGIRLHYFWGSGSHLLKQKNFFIERV
jgi:hypothetical protein